MPLLRATPGWRAGGGSPHPASGTCTKSRAGRKSHSARYFAVRTEKTAGTQKRSAHQILPTAKFPPGALFAHHPQPVHTRVGPAALRPSASLRSTTEEDDPQRHAHRQVVPGAAFIPPSEKAPRWRNKRTKPNRAMTFATPTLLDHTGQRRVHRGADRLTSWPPAQPSGAPAHAPPE